MASTRDSGYNRLAAVAATVMAVSAMAFFALFSAVSSADPRYETARFLSDAAANQGLASLVAWMNAWLGIVAMPLYVGLYFALRRAGNVYMLLASITGIAWGLILLVASPFMFTLLVYVAPAWATSTGTTRSELMSQAITLGWIVNATIGGTIFFLRALSVLAISRVLLSVGGKLWIAVGWLGVIFAIVHFVTGTLRVLVLGNGAAAGGTLLGAVGGVLLFVWLVGVAWGLWRLHGKIDTSPTEDASRTSQMVRASAASVEPS
jgi:hypothetical protein